MLERSLGIVYTLHLKLTILYNTIIMLTSLIPALKNWQDSLKTAYVRGLVLVSCSNSKVQLLKKNLNVSGIDFKEVPLSTLDSQKSSHPVSQLLGREFENIFFDARVTFDTNLFGAISGTLVGGGCLFLCLPEDILNEYFCFINQKNNQTPQNQTKNNNYQVLRRLLQQGMGKYCTAIISEDNYLFKSTRFTKFVDSGQQYQEQNQVIEKIQRVATGHANRPLVISADRGRGKSAAAGIAAARLLIKKTYSIIVTAPNFENLNTVFEHLILTLKHQCDSSDYFTSDRSSFKRGIQLENGSELKFVPVDVLIATKPETNLLIIDEAAAIPVHILEKLTRQHNRVVFSTTTHGYEGNGKGFNIRFKQKLVKLKPQTRFVQMTNPIRWSVNDELEKMSFEALLLNAQLHPVTFKHTSKKCIDNKQLKFVVHKKAELSFNDTLLKQIFTLLTHAHYQTRPADLEQMLSNTNLTVCSLSNTNNQVVAVALINQEGSFPPKLCQKIYNGEQRLKGDLLAQSLIIHHGQENAGKYKYFRIMRIAVHPHLQSNSIGCSLLQHLDELATARAVDFIGASFAADSQVTKFWLKSKYSVIRFGGSKDSSSGYYSSEAIKGLTPSAQLLQNHLISRFHESLFHKIHGELSELSCDIIKHLLHYQFQPLEKLSDNDISELNLFCNGKRGYSSIDWLLKRLLSQHLYHEDIYNLSSKVNYSFLIDFSIKQRPMKEIVRTYNFIGSKLVITKLREFTKVLLTDSNSSGY